MSSTPRIPPKNVPTLTQVVTPGQATARVPPPASAQASPVLPPKALTPSAVPPKLVGRDPLLPVSRSWEQVREPVVPVAPTPALTVPPMAPAPVSVPPPVVPEELVQQLVQAALVQAGAALEQQLAGRLAALVQAHLAQLLPLLQKEVEAAVWDNLGQALNRSSPPRR